MSAKDVDGISIQALKRLPIYLNYLEEQYKQGVEYTSMPKIGTAVGVSEILVKKDFANIITESGKPKVGHSVLRLITDIKNFLGYNDATKVVLVGCGKLGSALLCYNGFKQANMDIVCGFDNNPEVIGHDINDIKILDISKIGDICSRIQVHIGIITVGAEHAQEVANVLVAAGIRAIWNFAPKNIEVPKDVLVQNENLVSSLRILSKKLSVVLKEEL